MAQLARAQWQLPAIDPAMPLCGFAGVALMACRRIKPGIEGGEFVPRRRSESRPGSNRRSGSDDLLEEINFVFAGGFKTHAIP